MHAQSSVAIIVVNWNNPGDTSACLASLARLSGPRFTLYLVDNGSTDDSVARMTALLPTLSYPSRFIPLSHNGGFAHGNNVAIRRALADGHDALWLLNNDTEVEPDTLAQLLLPLREDSRVAMVGSRIYYAGTTTLWYAGASVNRWTGRAVVRGLNQPDHPRFAVPGPTGYVTGCSLLVRADVARKIGLMPADYFLYYEETDWNLRARRAGWISWYQPASVVHHKVGRSTSTGRGHAPVLIYYNLRNRFVMMQRTGSPAQRITTTAYLAWQLISQTRMILFRRRGDRSVRLRYLALGLRDALLRRMGPAPR